MSSDQTVHEIANSITGFDRIAIKKAFGVPFTTLAPDEKGQGGDSLEFLTALIFTHRRREGDNDITAYNTAEGMTIPEITEYFAEESAESGKDNSAPEMTPTSSPPGASSPDSPPLPGSN